MDTARADVHRLLGPEQPIEGACPENVRVALCAPGELWGGVEQFVETLSLRLSSTGVPIVVVALFDGPLRERLEKLGIPVTVVGKGGRYDLRALSDMIGVVRRHRITVIHTNGYKATILGAAAAAVTGARLVRTEHGRLEPAPGIEHFKMRLNEWLETLATRYRADAVAYVTRDVQRHSPTFDTRGLQQVIYNGMEPFGDTDENGPTPDGFSDTADAFRVGIIGRIVPVKGHKDLLEAFRSLRDLSYARLYVFGEGPLESELRTFATAAGLDDAVTFMGFRTNVRAYLRRLDVMAMPSLHEGLPYTLLEAMFCRVPVVASRVGGLAEIVEDGITGLLVPPSDPPALAEVLRHLHSDPGLRRKLAANAYAKAMEGFHAQTMATRYLEIYRAVVSR